jgi:hypothetical protein
MRSRILLAGLAGGIAEVLWVLAYGALTPLSTSEVAREVAASVIPQLAASAAAPALGVAIHLALSIALAYVFVAAAARLRPGMRSGAQTVAIAVFALAGVWALNFLVLLPLVNLRFVTLMPYAATLFSKALFGAVMGSVLAAAAPPRRALA